MVLRLLTRKCTASNNRGIAVDFAFCLVPCLELNDESADFVVSVIFKTAMIPEANSLRALVRYWVDDTLTFLRHDVPKIVLVLVCAFVLIRLLRLVTRKIISFQTRGATPENRVREVRTLISVVTNIGISVILFVAVLEILPMLGLNVGPLLASAGVAGLAIGFGAQTLVHDFINGFFILLDKEYEIGDKIQVAGVTGSVEEMTLRYTALRGSDGTLHFVPNSQITVVSNATRAR